MKQLCLTFVVALFGLILCGLSLGQKPKINRPDIPRTWDSQAIESFQMRLADPKVVTKLISSSYYYSIPVRPIYKSYSVYRPDREPRGYMDQLKRKAPQVVFDSAKLKSEADWTRAGELVFDAPIEYVADGILYSEIRGMDWFVKNKVPVTSEGVMPFMRWVVREKGKVELGILACGQCHTRIMPDGTIIKGAQGNFPDDRTFGYEQRIEAARSKTRTRSSKNSVALFAGAMALCGSRTMPARGQSECLCPNWPASWKRSRRAHVLVRARARFILPRYLI